MCKSCGHAPHEGKICHHSVVRNGRDPRNSNNFESCGCDKVDHSLNCQYCKDSGFVPTDYPIRDPSGSSKRSMHGITICGCNEGVRVVEMLKRLASAPMSEERWSV